MNIEDPHVQALERQLVEGRLDAISRACADLPVLDPRSADEIIGCGEHGLPR